MPQHECGSLHFAQPAQGGLDQLRDLAALGEPLGRGFGGRDAIQPIQSLFVLCRGLLLFSALARANQIEGAIRANAIQPCAESGAAVEAVNLLIGA